MAKMEKGSKYCSRLDEHVALMHDPVIPETPINVPFDTMHKECINN